MSVVCDRLGCNKPNGETTAIQTHVRRNTGRVAVRALVCRTNVRRTCVQEVVVSVIAIPPSPRPASRTRTRGRTTEQVPGCSGEQAVVRASSRPRLRLVTAGFVPEAPTLRAVDDDMSRPAVTHDTTSPALPVRRPSRPAVLRGHRPELERLAPQHPAVRAARLRESTVRRDGAPLKSRADVSAGPSRGRQERGLRFGADLRRYRGGFLVVVAAIVLICCGLMLGGLVGLLAPSSTAMLAQGAVGTTTTVVRPGQSLWEIAAASGTSDVPAMVARIVSLNGLQSAAVHSGQTLEVPVG